MLSKSSLYQKRHHVLHYKIVIQQYFKFWSSKWLFVFFPVGSIWVCKNKYPIYRYILGWLKAKYNLFKRSGGLIENCTLSGRIYKTYHSSACLWCLRTCTPVPFSSCTIAFNAFISSLSSLMSLVYLQCSVLGKFASG